MSKPDVKQVYKDLAYAARYWGKLFKQIKTDFEYALGKQWKEEDVRTLAQAGVKALTINKIRPMIKLITGIERQGRSDYVAFPEGGEDVLTSDVVTRLLKDIVKQSRVENKISEVFKEGMICGLSYLEPYMDYTYDLINGSLKFRKINATNVLLDPNGEEYDLSDRKYIIKITKDLSRDDLEMLFPGKNKKIDEIHYGKIDIEGLQTRTDKHIQEEDYPSFFKSEGLSPVEGDEKTFDLVEYYYKFPKNVFYAVSRSNGILKEVETEEEANQVLLEGDVQDGVVIQRKVPEIRLKQVVGDVEMSDDTSWSYPRYKGYPIFPYFSELLTVDMEETDLLIQGLVRSLKDLQDEYNKRRTQELRHLNSSINSGNFIPKDALDQTNKLKLKEYGSSPGVTIYYDPEKSGGTTPSSWRITPTPLSQGHAQLAQENAQDIKESSGVNPDLLANTERDASGRAILLKQRQGLVMVQEALDNYQQTKELLGRFMITQLGEVYTVESAIRVLGDDFIANNFKKPTFGEDGMPQLGPAGDIQTEVDEQEAGVIINKILNDSAVGKYDVSIGEGAFSETVRFANYLTLVDMAGKGIPIPPDIIISESTLSSEQKERILGSIEKMKSQMQQPVIPGGGDGQQDIP
jgi:hypothetical protein